MKSLLVFSLVVLVVLACGDDSTGPNGGNELPPGPPQFVLKWGSQGIGNGQFFSPGNGRRRQRQCLRGG